MAGFVLVTIRDPGLLLVMKETPDHGLSEEGRIPIAADAWGIAITKDERIAVVTSAWTHTVTGVDWRAKKVLWSVSVDREPRAVVIHPNGKAAYVSHLTSGDLSKIDDVGSETPKVTKVVFPAAPSRSPKDAKLKGSLGYALVMDDDGNRLLAARHALGAIATARWSGEVQSWFGVSTVDVLQTADDTPLLAPREPDKRLAVSALFNEMHAKRPVEGLWVSGFGDPDLTFSGGVQPRAMVIARRSRTVWLASEGEDAVYELSLYAPAPMEDSPVSIAVGSNYRDKRIMGMSGNYETTDGIPGQGGAPTGLALSADETLLYVFCRSTYDIATIRVSRPTQKGTLERVSSPVMIARVAADTTEDSLSRGRRLFYGALDRFSSGGMGCAGCHPEGRDDGHVWHDVKIEGGENFLASERLVHDFPGVREGYPRQTPMLAGRVGGKGPYGWHGQDDTLSARLDEGFELHRWGRRIAWSKPPAWMTNERAEALATFLRRGIAPPPRPKRDLTEVEKKGKAIFESDATKCTQCHPADSEYTTRMSYPMKKGPPMPGFLAEDDNSFKAPSLLFVGGTAPYYHDGSAPTLEALITNNQDRMGKTSQLSADERAALVAYLETL